MRFGVKLVSAKEMQEILEEEDVQLVDVRTKEEYARRAHSKFSEYRL